jgi:hypothetical protein
VVVVVVVDVVNVGVVSLLGCFLFFVGGLLDMSVV